MKKLSVIIVNYNVKYFLEQAILSSQKSIQYAKNLHSEWDIDIFVVDNQSVDKSVEMVESHFPDVKIIANTVNYGFSYANNQAIKQSDAEFVLLLNPDTVIQEDTLEKTISYMDANPNAGALGVKMVDGKGVFLPESKRGLPTPKVAFYKIFGLSKLFPKSREFGRYHLGYLAEDDINEVDVLAGAFMLIRKSVLDKIGLLDETFFMYGEDIDLSYRVTQAGYKNIYFPNTRIIHYKGESTKKGSLNYVFIFYQAMIIFANKHFSKQRAALFSVLIQLAVYLRAFVAIVNRAIKQLSLPIIDFFTQYAILYLLVSYWERTIKYINGGKYPDILFSLFIPLYTFCWIIGIFLAGGYHAKNPLKHILKGVLIGSLILFVGYAFIEEQYRFSRAIILLGSMSAFGIFSVNRLVVNFIRTKSLFIKNNTKRIAIVGGVEEAERVKGLLDKIRLEYSLVGFLSQSKQDSKLNPDYIGCLEDIEEISRIFSIDELIFCGKDIPSEEIISCMAKMQKSDVHFKIVPDKSMFIIGSNSKDAQGDYYTMEIQLKLLQEEAQWNKRMLDIFTSAFLLLTFPLNIWFISHKKHYLLNLVKVLFNKATFVSYSLKHNTIVTLPKIKQGILNPIHAFKYKNMDEATKMRLDFLYAKDYSIFTDIEIITKSITQLGNKI